MWALALLLALHPLLSCSQESNPRATVVLYHGLNHNPETFHPIARYLQSLGFRTCIATLAGHDSEESKHQVTSEQWRNDARTVLEQLNDRYPETPLYAVGYSIGAAVLVSAILSEDKPTVDRMVLIAPPFALTRASYLLRLLLPLRVVNLSLPSMSPPQYRRFDSTSLDAYNAAVLLVDSLEHISNPARLAEIPTTILRSNDDELVSASGLDDWVADNQLSSWRIQEITVCGPHNFHHLGIDEHTLGSASWNELKQTLAERFAAPTNPGM